MHAVSPQNVQLHGMHLEEKLLKQTPVPRHAREALPTPALRGGEPQLCLFVRYSIAKAILLRNAFWHVT
eukprot:1482816-Alexandrium_andersonii.AAC.1